MNRYAVPAPVIKLAMLCRRTIALDFSGGVGVAKTEDEIFLMILCFQDKTEGCSYDTILKAWMKHKLKATLSLVGGSVIAIAVVMFIDARK